VLALRAAEDSCINRDVALVNALGGGYDLRQLLRASTTHSAAYEGREQSWSPAQATVALLAQNLLCHLLDDDRQRLQPGFQEVETIRLSDPAASWVYSVLTTTDRVRIDGLLAATPAEYDEGLQKLSPSSNSGQLHARLFIMYDVSDPYILAQESYHLADAVRDSTQVVHAESRLFKHAQPRPIWERVELVGEGLKLVFYVAKIFHSLN
jgi:hypothetical protein